MARIPYPDESSLDEATRKLMGTLGRPMNLFRMLGHSYSALRSVVSGGSQILRHFKLDPALREIAILRVAGVSGADYERLQHVPIALACGVRREQVDALESNDTQAACFDARERAIIAAADELIVSPRLSDQALAGLQTFLPEAELIELIVTISYYMMIARILESTGVDMEEGGAPAPEAIDPKMTQAG